MAKTQLVTCGFLRAKGIDEAQRIAPLDQLGVTLQCGFSSSVHSNPLTEAEEEAKFARLVEVARDVWGSV
jgi:5-methyltetrahydropteroyltriglutamate--homocysteine methyltransferase